MAVNKSTIVTGGNPGILPTYLSDDGTARTTIVNGLMVNQISGGAVWATVEAPDIFAAVGYVGAPGTQVSIATTETQDIFAFTGNVAAVGTLAVTEQGDVFSAFIKQPITATMAITEAQDIFAAIGFGRGVDGSMILTEHPDIFAAIGVTPVIGTMAASETPDRVQIIGNGVSRVRPRRNIFIT